MPDERQLILGFRRGHGEALRQIYDRYKVELLKLAVLLLGDVNTGEDVVHDVFVGFARSADRFTAAGSLRSYLTTSVLNGVRNHVRDTRRRSEVSLDGAPEAACPEQSPQHWAIASEELQRLVIALDALPYEQREVVCLHVEAGLTFRRIAATQKASVNTVKGRYRHGIEKLRSLLDGEVKTCNPQTT